MIGRDRAWGSDGGGDSGRWYWQWEVVLAVAVAVVVVMGEDGRQVTVIRA